MWAGRLPKIAKTRSQTRNSPQYISPASPAPTSHPLHSLRSRSQGLASGTGFTSLPKKVVNVTLTHINSLTSTLASRHANYPRHDKHMARSFLLTTVLNPATPPLTPSQTLTTETTLATFSSLPWATLPYTLPRPWSYSYVPNTTMTRLTLACDTSAQAVLAEVWFTCSYDRMARHVKLSGKVARKEVGRGGREKVCVMGEKVKVRRAKSGMAGNLMFTVAHDRPLFTHAHVHADGLPLSPAPLYQLLFTSSSSFWCSRVPTTALCSRMPMLTHADGLPLSPAPLYQLPCTSPCSHSTSCTLGWRVGRRLQAVRDVAALEHAREGLWGG